MMNDAVRTARHWEPADRDSVRCVLCPHRCRIRPGQQGLCGVRENREGRLVTLVYGLLSALAMDPIEKKPLRRFHPGSRILSAGSLGCNLACPFCQNHRIAKAAPGDVPATILSPRELADQALAARSQGNIGIAYTYNEPTVWFEYMHDTAKHLRQDGMFNVMVTNGYIEPEPLTELLGVIDAFNIDLKGFQDSVYRNLQGSLRPVQETIRRAFESGTHVEVTTLVIPDLNDSSADMDSLCRWLASISPDIALHLSRFFPMYRMKDRAPTPADTILALEEIARRHLNHVYIGNMS